MKYLGLWLSAVVCTTATAVLTLAADELTPHQAMTRALYKEVVETPTSVEFNNTPELAAGLAQHFLAAGFDRKDITEHPTGDQMSLIVRYPGADRTREGIGFMAHMDVVSALKKDWELDPFKFTERGEFFIGRGVADNKAGVTALTATFIKLKKEGYLPDRDLVIIFSGDEETAMATIKSIAKEQRELLNIEFAFNSDGGGGMLSEDLKPLLYGVQAAEKTYHSVLLTVTNPGGHSSLPRRENAIYQLVHALQKIEAHQFPVRVNDVTRGFFIAMAKREDASTAKAMLAIAEDPEDEAAAAVLSENVLYNATLRTTCVATMLTAGHAENALPQSAEATVNCRIMPGISPADIEAELARVIADPGVKISPFEDPSYAPASELRDDVMAAVDYALEQHYPGVPVVPNMSTGATDGKELRAVGVQVYGTGGLFGIPGETRAHGLNEKIRVDAFYKSLDHWERLIRFVSGGVKGT